ncbi:MAG: DUF1622 domain-containing protein [Thermomicrobiales bacterium]|nr:DUF1622 domain-containing protein [Thermomicrobiales bacterium]
MEFIPIVEFAGRVMEAVGVTIIVVGALLALANFLRSLTRQGGAAAAYRTVRTGVAQAILLGLEFLVAGDIIRTVAVEPTFANVGVLAIIVLIRTFLSLDLTMEIEGRWPWQASGQTGADTDA